MGIEPKLPSPEPDQYTKLPRPLPDTEGHSSRTQIVSLLPKLLMSRTSAQKVTSSCWVPLSHPWARRQTKRLFCCADQSETQGLPMRSFYLSLSSEEGSGFVRDGEGERHGGPGTFRHIDFSVLAPVITHRLQRRDSNGFLPYFFFLNQFHLRCLFYVAPRL